MDTIPTSQSGRVPEHGWRDIAMSPCFPIDAFGRLWPALGTFEERDKGTITPGKLGDFTVISADPRAIEPDALFDLRAEATIIGGDVVWEM